MKYIANSFSLSMLPMGGSIKITRCRPSARDGSGTSDDGLTTVKYTADDIVVCGDRAGRRCTCQSYVGHADIARLMAISLRCRDIAVNRDKLVLAAGDELFVGQYMGPRLPEGTTTLPDGATIEWYRVVVLPAPAPAPATQKMSQEAYEEMCAKDGAGD